MMQLPILPDPADVPLEQLPEFVLQLSALLAAASARLVANGHQNGNGNGAGIRSDAGDRLLGIQDAAERLAVTPDWLRRRSHLPFVVRLSDATVRYSASGITRFLAAQQRRG
jgi:hypothetical protein